MEDRNAPATKGDIADVVEKMEQLRTELRADFKHELGEQSAQLRAESHHEFDDLRETMRDMQTELLKAFYSFAQSTDVKLKDSEMTEFMLRQRLTVVESRVTDLERRLNTPPAA